MSTCTSTSILLLFRAHTVEVGGGGEASLLATAKDLTGSLSDLTFLCGKVLTRGSPPYQQTIKVNPVLGCPFPGIRCKSYGVNPVLPRPARL